MYVFPYIYISIYIYIHIYIQIRWFQTRIVIKPGEYIFDRDVYVECGMHCACQGKCGRKMIKGSKIAKKVAIKYMGGSKGFGVVTQQPIAAGLSKFFIYPLLKISYIPTKSINVFRYAYCWICWWSIS